MRTHFLHAPHRGAVSPAAAVGGGGFNPRANKDPIYSVVVTNYGFSATIPAVSDAPIGDGSGWYSLFNTAGNTTRVSDSTGPESPPYCIQHLWPTGHPGGSGTGHVYYTGMPTVNGIYVQFNVWHDANFEWNDTSNKMMELRDDAGGGGAILESSHFTNDMLAWQFENVAGTPYYVCNTPFGSSLLPSDFEDTWWNIEVDYRFGSPTGGALNVWAARCDGSDGPSGQLVLSYSNIDCPYVSFIQENSTWGGGGGPKVRDSYRRHDNYYIAVEAP